MFGRKDKTRELPRKPLADIVIFPGAPVSQCPHCIGAPSRRDYRSWPAVGSHGGGRLLYGCAHGHRWVTEGCCMERP